MNELSNYLHYLVKHTWLSMEILKLNVFCWYAAGLELVRVAIEKAGYTGRIQIGMDVAASEFCKQGKYDLDFKNPQSDPNHWVGKLKTHSDPNWLSKTAQSTNQITKQHSHLRLVYHKVHQVRCDTWNSYHSNGSRLPLSTYSTQNYTV